MNLTKYNSLFSNNPNNNNNNQQNSNFIFNNATSSETTRDSSSQRRDSSLEGGLLFEREKYGSTVNPSWSMSNTKSRYDRIRQKARLHLGQSPSIVTRAECCGDSTSYSPKTMEKMKNSKSLVLLATTRASSSGPSMLNEENNGGNHKSTSDLNSDGNRNGRPLSAAYHAGYHSSSNIMRPLSASSHSLNNNWYKPRQLQLPKSVSCGDGLKQHHVIGEEQLPGDRKLSESSKELSRNTHKKGKLMKLIFFEDHLHFLDQQKNCLNPSKLQFFLLKVKIHLLIRVLISIFDIKIRKFSMFTPKNVKIPD